MFEEPRLESPFRVMIFGACREKWYAASDGERSDRALPAFYRLLEEWKDGGLRIVASFDDDYFLVGQPGSLQYSFFILAEIESFERLIELVNLARQSRSGVRPDEYFRFEARAGRRLFALDR